MRAAALRPLSALALVASMLVPHAGVAQTSDAGASFLLVPTDPRDVALGGATVADPLGTSALFKNPAAFARLTGRAVDVDYGVDQVGSRVVASVSGSSAVIGTFGAGVYRYGLGTEEALDSTGAVTGVFSLADYSYAASYAVAFTPRFTAGVTAKLVQYELACSGTCGSDQPAHPSTGAVDAGVQFDLGRGAPIHVAAALRNFGLRLQNKDRAQADPLPTQLALGAGWDVPHVERYAPDASLRVLAEATHGVGVRLGGSYHVGAEAAYRKTVTVRAGYAHYTESAGYGGLAAGFGVVSSRFMLDVARQITTNAVFADKPPTYVGLRYSF